MLILIMRKAPAPENAEELFPILIERIRDQLRPLIAPTLQRQAEILAIPLEILCSRAPTISSEYEFFPKPVTRCGEIFTNGKSLYIVTLTAQQIIRPRPRNADGTGIQELVQETSCTLTLNYIGPEVKPVALSEIEKIVNQVFGIKLKPHSYPSESFTDLKSQGRNSPPEPSRTELEAARILCDRATRSLITSIKASGGLLVRDLPKQLPQGDRSRTDEIQAALRSKGLIEAEVVLICTKTQAQIGRVPNIDSLAQLAAQGFKCACGRPIIEERNEEALAITDLGRNLLDRSRWLTLVVLEELAKVGIPIEHTLIDQQVGGDEMDLLANISGELVLIELKDKEFNLGNAYSFGAKIGIIRPKYPVIFTTEYVGNDAKDHFKRAQLATKPRRRSYYSDAEDESTEIRYIEGLENLADGIAELVTKIYSKDAAQILADVLPMATVAPGALINALSHASSQDKTT